MAGSGDSEFYIGYLKQAPPGLSRFLLRTVAGLLALTGAVAALVASRQAPFAPGTFEYGVTRPFTGVVAEAPYPTLAVERPGTGGGATEGQSRYYLVATGKQGAAPEVEGLNGKRVRLEGTLIWRDRQTMIEVAAGSVTVQAGELPREGPGENLGKVTVRGEIVDSKCYLGVMKPGRGKPHRACASLCIRGGIPPLLRVEGQDGATAHLLLVDEEGRAVNDRVLDRVAEPVEITGLLRRHGELLVLAADPEDYLRLE